MDTPGALDGIELRALGLARSFMAGAAMSVFRGTGMEPDGVRPYVAGDDVRALDWRVTARTGRPHVRERTDDRELGLRLVVDRSGSLHGGVAPLPARVALAVAGALAAAAVRGGRRVGLMHFADTAETMLPPGSGRRHLRHVLSALHGEYATGHGTDLAATLARAGAELKSRATVAVVSDFRVPARCRDAAAAALHRVARGHELLLVRVRVVGPEALPVVGRVAVVDPESGERREVDTSSRAVRATLLEEARRAEGWWVETVGRLGVTPVDLDPGAPLAPQLAGALAVRWRRGA
jgi:uncharacterized protein (DUF58 family)